MDTYAAVAPFDMEANKQRVTVAYNPNQPIELLFGQIDDGITFADLGENPFTPVQVVDTALLLLVKATVFQDNIKEWNKMSMADQTWPHFQTFFAKAHQDWKKNLHFTSDQHFPRANAVEASVHPNAKHYETRESLANLATFTASNFATVP